jgi:hypothetical protein
VIKHCELPSAAAKDSSGKGGGSGGGGAPAKERRELRHISLFGGMLGIAR